MNIKTIKTLTIFFIVVLILGICPQSVLARQVVAKQKNLAGARISIPQVHYTYTGATIRPPVTVYLDGSVVASSNYTISYSNNIYPGTAKITVKATGQSYIGSTSRTFYIDSPNSQTSSKVDEYSLKNATITRQYYWTYTGKEIKPAFTVRCGGKYLTNGVDYVYEYQNNIEPGMGMIIVMAKGKYKGTAISYFEIKKQTATPQPTKVSIADPKVNIILSKTEYTYTGSVIKPNMTITYNSKTLKQGTDYTYNVLNGVNPGTATIQIYGIGNFYGSTTRKVTIKSAGQNKININNCKVSLSNETFLYSGAKIKPKVTIYYGSTKLLNTTDYRIVYKNNINAGTGQVIIYGKGKYNGTKTCNFNITQKSINVLEIACSNSYIYTGSEIKPNPTIVHNGKRLVLNKEYTVTYTNNKNVGTATMKITGIGNYNGSVQKTFEIKHKNIAYLQINVKTIYVYTGSLIQPEIKIMHNKETLKMGIDYTYQVYNGGTNVGNAIIQILGKGNYYGCKNIKITIKAKDISSLTIYTKQSNYVYSGNEIKPTYIIKDNKQALKEDKDYTITYKNNKNAGTAMVIIKGKGNYSGTLKKEFKIEPKTINDLYIEPIKACEFRIDKYGNTACEPNVSIKHNQKQLIRDTDYEVTYKNNTLIGTAQAIIKGINNYQGTVELYFEIKSGEDAKSNVVEIALSFIGTKYVAGGKSPEDGGFDCAGFVQYVYQKAGYTIQKKCIYDQADGIPVDREELLPGDLVFFDTETGHVGIYIGNNQFIHAPKPGDVVQITELIEGQYFDEHYIGARRIIDE